MSAVLGAWRATTPLTLRVDAGGSTETLTVSVTAGREYWVSGDGASDSAAGDGDLLAIIASALITHSAISSATVTLIAGRVRITTDAAASYLWTDAATTLPSWVLGFRASDTTAATTIDAPDTCPLVWLAPDDISDDTRDRQELVRGRRSTLSGAVYTARWMDAAKRRDVGWRLVGQDRILEEYARSARTAWESLDRRSLSLGRRLRVYEDHTTLPTAVGYATYRLEEAPRVERDGAYPYRWDVQLRLRQDGADTRGTVSGVTATGWVDATGITWPLAWDATAAAGGTAAFPALFGGVDIATDAGTYSMVAPPTGMVPSSLGLAQNLLASADSGLFEGSAAIASLASSDPIHLRFLGLSQFNGGFIQIGSDTTSRLRIFTVSNAVHADYADSAGTRYSRSTAYTYGTALMLDVLVYASGSSTRIDLYANRTLVSGTSGISYGGIGLGSITIAYESWSGDFGLLAIRRTSSFTQSLHDDACSLVGVP